MICPHCQNISEIHYHNASWIGMAFVLSVIILVSTVVVAVIVNQQEAWLKYLDKQTCEAIFQVEAEQMIHKKLERVR